MRKIRKGLYIGDIQDARRCLVASVPDSAGNPVPAAVLSLSNVSGLEARSPDQGIARPAHMVVSLLDDNTADLLPHLPECLDFISRHLEADVGSERETDAVALADSQPGPRFGSVLVHCHAGVSRSAAVIIAYLMRAEHLRFSEALASLQQYSERAQPNDNFCRQLLLFERMGCKVDASFADYQQHCSFMAKSQ
eukprot:jgi/Mesvir1/24445/Mv13631-RA.1